MLATSTFAAASTRAFSAPRPSSTLSPHPPAAVCLRSAFAGFPAGVAYARKTEGLHGRRRRQMRAAQRLSTRAPQAKIGDSLEEFLMEATEDPKLRQVMMSMSEAVRTISHKVKSASCSGTACINYLGQEELPIHMLADRVLFEALRFSGVCSLAFSETEHEPLNMFGEGFCVAFDPLDGSSILDTNFTVGTVLGVWPGDSLLGRSGYEQVAAALGVYGPRTVYCLTIDGYPGTHEFLLQDDGKWIHVKETTSIREGKIFSPGNLRAAADSPNYKRLLEYYLEQRYTLRYTGGMVPDVFQIMVKEEGVFTHVTSPSCPAKLGLGFEVAPMALLVERAGGCSSGDGRPDSALAVKLERYDQQTQVCFGSREEVKRFEEFMYGRSPRFERSPGYVDPVEEWCERAPDATECRLYD